MLGVRRLKIAGREFRAVLPGRCALLPLVLAAEQAQAAEGVAIQPDRRPQIGQGVGVVGQSLVGQLDLGEADHRMGPLAVWPDQAELASEGMNSRLLWYLPPREVSLTALVPGPLRADRYRRGGPPVRLRPGRPGRLFEATPYRPGPAGGV